MPKNFNIQTKCKSLATKGAIAAIGSTVAAGMNRYVTFVTVMQNTGGAGKGSRVFFCSAAASGSMSTIALASAAQKISVQIPSAVASHVVDKTIQIPLQPNSENPLFSIAAGKMLVVKLASAAGGSAAVDVFVQYYDQ